jgi:hypothetical protein
MKKSIAKKRNTDDVFELFEDNYWMSKEYIEKEYKMNWRLPTLYKTLEVIDKLWDYYDFEVDYSYRSVQCIQMTLAKFDYDYIQMRDWIDSDFWWLEDWADLIEPDCKPLYVHLFD